MNGVACYSPAPSLAIAASPGHVSLWSEEIMGLVENPSCPKSTCVHGLSTVEACMASPRHGCMAGCMPVPDMAAESQGCSSVCASPMDYDSVTHPFNKMHNHPVPRTAQRLGTRRRKDCIFLSKGVSSYQLRGWGQGCRQWQSLG